MCILLSSAFGVFQIILKIDFLRIEGVYHHVVCHCGWVRLLLNLAAKVVIVLIRIKNDDQFFEGQK
jgi:hypothetical protein